MAGALNIIWPFIAILLLIGTGLAIICYIDFRRQCRADDETKRLRHLGHLRVSP